jgi:DNA-binding NarL/FixJ family response regulator
VTRNWRLRLAIADDHDLVAAGLALLLSDHHDIGGIAASGKALTTLLEHTPIDCVLLDISMADQGGLDVLPELRRRWPALKIVMLTMHNDRALADEALHLGADGYVPKDVRPDELMMAIDLVAAGRTYVSPRVPKYTDQVGIHAFHPILLSLTPRQEQILLLLAEGKSTAAIADLLDLSESTVTFHRANLRKKLGISTDHALHGFAALIRQMLRDRPPQA